MQNPLSKRLWSSEAIGPTRPIKLIKLDTPVRSAVFSSRLLTHIIILGLVLGMMVVDGFAKLSPRQLQASMSKDSLFGVDSINANIVNGLSVAGIITPNTTEAVIDKVDEVSIFPMNNDADQSGALTLPNSLNKETALLTPAVIPSIIIAEPEAKPIVQRTTLETYEVQPGDTVFGIAIDFDLAPETILWANPALEDNPDLLRLGQALTILPVDGMYYQVKNGDSISGLASTYKVEPDAITKYPLNELTSENSTIFPGQWLILPNGIKPYVAKKVRSATVNAPSDAQQGTGNFQWPADGNIGQDFWSRHPGLDIGAYEGAPIYAADSGYVVAAQWDDTGYGRMVIIDHGNGFKTLYAHMNVYFVELGQEVAKGQTIGKMGSTGNSTGPHLHFEILRNGVKRNPWGFMP